MLPSGNINTAASAPSVDPSDLKTPTIKSPTYTTGRGGTGNMAKNDPENPQLAREAQDVEATTLPKERAAFHTGRGGDGNAVSKTADGLKTTEQHSKEAREGEQKPRRGSFKELAGKGKDILFGGRDKEKGGNVS